MRRFVVCLILACCWSSLASAAEAPLRVFIRSGPKSHGPGQHDHPRFLADWVPLLNARGAKATGSNQFPSAAQLAETDVLVLHAQDGGNIGPGPDRTALEDFLRRGGGLVVIHAAAVSNDPDWYKSITGGSWRNGTTKWLEGPMHLYFTDRDSPLTKDCSNWTMDDEIYYDMDLQPDVRVLAAAYTPKSSSAGSANSRRRADELTAGGKRVGIYDIQPQLWTYEHTLAGGAKPYRAVVSIPGHYYETFNRPNYRAILLRSIVWAGGRDNVDHLCKAEELGDNLRYVEGGPVRPTQAAAMLEVHHEFKVELVASEPLVNKVMGLDWDEKGRLWVCETPEYPNGRRLPNVAPWKETGSLHPYRPERDPEDRISILADTDGDGVMDHKQVFADKLELVTSFVLYRRGVIAATSPDIWYLEDTDGDGVADKRTKLYTGLGINDTHAVINNLRWGLDGWIYATHGYSRGEVISPDGKKSFGPDGSGVVRFKPDGSAFEQYSSRSGNTWGLDITWNGQVFWTQPTSGTVFFHTVLPESVLAKGKMPGVVSWKGMITGQKTYPLMPPTEQAYVQVDQVGRFTAAAGCAIYEGGSWPAKWNYSYFTCEPTLNIVHQEFVTPDGVSYNVAKETGREETEFIRSRDPWFRPIEARVGPDGALYVVDFYNQAVSHNDTRGPIHGPANAALRPDRDHFFSRIWRVQHKDSKLLPVPALERSDLASLVKVIETSPNIPLRKTALRLAQENHAGAPALARLAPPMGSPALARYERARGATSNAERQAVVDGFLAATDDWTKSALIAAASEHPADFILLTLATRNGSGLVDFVTPLLAELPAARANEILRAVVATPATDASLQTIVLRGLATLPADLPALTPASSTDLGALLDRPATAALALPLIARWGPGNGELKTRADRVAQALQDEFASANLPEPRRVELASSLLAYPATRESALPRIAALLGDAQSSSTLKASLVTTLGELPGAQVNEILVSTYVQSHAAPLLEQILRRPASSLALLSAIKAGKVRAADLGPGNVARLRTHPNRQVAQEAAALKTLLNPESRQKDEIIAGLLAEVVKPGDVARGRALFSAACAVCHKLGDLGQREVGPSLNGMGAHGPAELLVHVIDPNREVDPSYWQWNVTTKQGDTLVGVIAGENEASLVLRNQGSDTEVKKGNIVTRENSRRSLMPEGFEGLGAEGLRDLLAFICAGEQDFRLLDLRDAYTADSRRGAFQAEEKRDETVALSTFGNVIVAGVPFFIMDPAKSASAANLVVLRGGTSGKNYSDSFPRRVLIKTDTTAASLHFLGGVAGWGWPIGGETMRGKPALQVTVRFADGTSEQHVLRNGETFIDYPSTADLPEGKKADNLTRLGQLRYFALNLGKKAALQSVELESFDNGIAPCTVAVTASAQPASPKSNTLATPAGPAATSAATLALPNPKEGGKGDAPLPALTQPKWEAGKTKVLIIGGGSSHNFGKFFGETDSATLRAAGFTVHYTEDRDQATELLGEADLAVISVNRRYFDSPAYRQALMAFTAAGKGLILLHPGTWYGYAEWPGYNATLVGGGARGHDRLGPYQVKAVKPNHPLMKGVPGQFEVVDELYYLNAEADKIPAGTSAIEVLAESSPSQKYQRPHPVLWITAHPRARIVGFTLGHDERVHDLPAYQVILTNAARWVSEKP